MLELMNWLVIDADIDFSTDTEEISEIFELFD